MKRQLTNAVLITTMCLLLSSMALASDGTEARSAENVESLVAADTRTEQELAASLCVNEATWRELDCTIITQIRMRSAQQRGISFREVLVLLHGDRAVNRDGSRRMTASLRSDRVVNPHDRDARSWIGDLRADGHRPFGFPDDGSWEGRYRAEYLKIYTLVGEVLAGRVASPCVGAQPNTWGGPRVDREALERKFAQGFTRAQCGGTWNIFLAGGPSRGVPANAPTPPRVQDQSADIRPAFVVPQNDG